VTFLLNIELALAEGVPKLDGAVTATTDNLSVIGREGNGKDIGGVTNKAAGRETGVKVPEAEGVVPRGGESELTIGGDHDVRHEMVMAMENFLGAPVLRLVSCELPDDDGLVTRRGQE